MTDATFKKNFNASELDAIIIIKTQKHILKIEGNEFKRFYENFETSYNQCQKIIEPNGQNIDIMGNHLYTSIIWSKKFIQAYANTRVSYGKSVHFLGASFGRLLGAVQFGFKANNPDILKFKNNFIEEAQEITSILKIINPEIKLEEVPKRILKIYHENIKETHFFAAEFAQQLSR